MPPAYLKSTELPRILLEGRTRCVGKVKFDSFLIANRVAARRRREKPRDAYRCDDCGKWHLGSGGENGDKSIKFKELTD